MQKLCLCHNLRVLFFMQKPSQCITSQVWVKIAQLQLFCLVIASYLDTTATVLPCNLLHHWLPWTLGVQERLEGCQGRPVGRKMALGVGGGAIYPFHMSLKCLLQGLPKSTPSRTKRKHPRSPLRSKMEAGPIRTETREMWTMPGRRQMRDNRQKTMDDEWVMDNTIA